MRAEEDILAQQQIVLRHLSRSLQGAVVQFESTAENRRRTFPEYKKARADYMEIQAMIFTITDKAGEMRSGVPDGLRPWLIRMRLRGVATFTKVSVTFFRNPPALLVQALGAYEILEMERESMTSLLSDYDMLLFEAGLDDKTADALDKVRVDIEEVVTHLTKLVQTAPPPLAKF